MLNVTSLRRGAHWLAVFVVLSFLAAPAAAQRPTLDGLQQQINTLTATVNAQVAVINNLANQLAALQGNTVLALHQKLTYDAGSQTARFTGIDVRIDNGAALNVINGKGNLIVGYNTARSVFEVCSIGSAGTQSECSTAGGVWAAGHKSGSHNLIVGEEHAYSSYGGGAFGFRNSITSIGATVTGGQFNVSRGEQSAVGGGIANVASGNRSSAGGGQQNAASGPDSSVSGGASNKASGDRSSVSGGAGNTASGFIASVSGGAGNTASGDRSSASGGLGNTASGFLASVGGGDNNQASGEKSSVSGGLQNTASGMTSTVSGGQGNVASGASASVSGGSTRIAADALDWAAGGLSQDQ